MTDDALGGKRTGPETPCEELLGALRENLLDIQGCVSLLIREGDGKPPDRAKLLRIQDQSRQALQRIDRGQSPPAVDEAEAVVSPAQQIPNRETILLVDDEEAILDVTRDMLETLGYRVRTAQSGEEALRAFQSQRDRIDLVLLDMVLADGDGGEVFDRLRAIQPGIPIIIASGYSLGDRIRGIMTRGGHAFLQKPFGLARLSETIREVLDRTSP